MAGGSEGAGAGAACSGTAGPPGSGASPAWLLFLLMLSIGDRRVRICAVQSHLMWSRDITPHNQHANAKPALDSFPEGHLLQPQSFLG